MTLSKVLTAVITKVEFAHITAVEGVRQTACNALRALGLNVTPVVRTLVIEQQSVDSMLLLKRMVVAQREL